MFSAPSSHPIQTYNEPLAYHHFHLPCSPSPLRTARNANLMSTPNHTKPYFSSEQENRSQITSEAIFTPTDTNSIRKSTGSSNPRPSITNNNSSSFVNSKFSFEQKARSSSPAVVLSNHAQASRERRKGMFLERLRQRRDDERSDKYGDQVQRMDFVRERRAWEESMAQHAASQEMDEFETNTEFEVDQMAEEMSPPEEEWELEALVDSFLQADDQRSQQFLQGNHEERSSLDQISDDDDYDQLFMEVIYASQDPQGLQAEGGLGAEQSHPDSSMDVS